MPRASVFLNLIPVFTAVIAAPTLGERPGLAQPVGGLLVVGGVHPGLLEGPREIRRGSAAAGGFLGVNGREAAPSGTALLVG